MVPFREDLQVFPFEIQQLRRIPDLNRTAYSCKRCGLFRKLTGLKMF